MLFDIRPKSKREDLFDREKELEVLYREIDKPLIVLAGIRRIGKTSILKVFLNEINIPSIIIDLRGLRSNYGYRDLYSLIADAASQNIGRLERLLRGIRGVKISGLEVEIKWRGREAASLASLFDGLSRERFILAFDEAQKLRGPRGREVLDAIAHAYDYDENLTIILTGSEVGLLLDFIGIDNPESPLYGRYVSFIEIDRFSPDASREFLNKGFSEAGFEVDEDVIERAVQLFDGIPGWLTMFGMIFVSRGGVAADEVMEIAVKLAEKELRELGRRSPRYIHVLKAIASGANTWGSVMKYVEAREGGTVSKGILSNVLTTVRKMGIVKNYEFLDPVYREAASRL